MLKKRLYEREEDYICLLRNKSLELEDISNQKIQFEISLCVKQEQGYDDEYGNYLEFKLKENNYSLSQNGFILLKSDKKLSTEEKFNELFNYLKNNRELILNLVGLSFS